MAPFCLLGNSRQSLSHLRVLPCKPLLNTESIDADGCHLVIDRYAIFRSLHPFRAKLDPMLSLACYRQLRVGHTRRRSNVRSPQAISIR